MAGVEYDDMIDQELLRKFCVRKHKKAKATAERTVKHSDIGDVNDNSTDIGTSDRRRKVFKPDGRDELKWEDRNHYLWRRTLYIEYWGGDGTYQCTASMISEYWAITSAHCVWGNGDWYGDWKIWSHVHSCSDLNHDNLYNGIKAVTFAAYVDAMNSGNRVAQMNWDIAWIKLDRATTFGSFGYGYNPGFSGYMIFDVISYPSDMPDCKKYFQSCRQCFFFFPRDIFLWA